MNILFICSGNSSRSQMAEALARDLFRNEARVESAGSDPTEVSPLAVQVMKEIGLDISNNKAKSFGALSTHFADHLDYLITLCDEETPPILTSPSTENLRWILPDPARISGNKDDQIKRFRTLRDQLKEKIRSLVDQVSSRARAIDIQI